MTARRRSLVLTLVAPLMAGGIVALPSAPAQAAVNYPKKCFTVRSPGDAQSHRECYKPVRRVARDFKVGDTDSLVNRTDRTARLDCTISQSRSFTYGGSVSMSASIKAGIFASIDATVEFNVSKSMTSGTAVNAGISVPPRTTTLCQRVVYRERFRVCKRVTYYGQTSGCDYFTFWAPSRRGWVLKDA